MLDCIVFKFWNDNITILILNLKKKFKFFMEHIFYGSEVRITNHSCDCGRQERREADT